MITLEVEKLLLVMKPPMNIEDGPEDTFERNYESYSLNDSGRNPCRRRERRDKRAERKQPVIQSSSWSLGGSFIDRERKEKFLTNKVCKSI